MDGHGGSLAAAVEEMPEGYDQLMIPVIENIPVMIAVLVLTVPVAMLSMRLADRLATCDLSHQRCRIRN